MERRTFARSILPGLAGAALWKIPEKAEPRKIDLARLRLCADFVNGVYERNWIWPPGLRAHRGATSMRFPEYLVLPRG